MDHIKNKERPGAALLFYLPFIMILICDRFSAIS